MAELPPALRAIVFANRFTLTQRWAVRPQDVRRALLDIEPQIVHFTGHGTGEDGLILEDASGKGQLVSGEASRGSVWVVRAD